MAKYTIRHSCGHEEVKQLYGKTRDRERKIAWLEDQPCYECYQKKLEQEQQEQNQAAAAENRAAGLPDLHGTEKQIAWAETIRAEKIAKLAKLEGRLVKAEELVKNAPKVDPTKSKRRQANIAARDYQKAFERISNLGFADFDEYFRACHQAIENLQTKDSAAWWIDNRDVNHWQDIMEEDALKIVSLSKDDTDTAQQAMAEATLSPAEPISNTPAEISATDTMIRIKYPVKKREFWQVVKPELGFSWSGKLWEKKIGVTDGLITDRIAEAGHRLLAAGFKVVIWDEAARSKAVAGDYEPRHSRWIVKRPDGQFGIHWGRNEDFYSDARNITGSRWSKPYVKVAPTEYLEVLDFAKIHDFRLSPGAQKLVEEQEMLGAAAMVVDVAPVKEEAPVNQERPELSPEQVSGEIDADLRDN